MKKRYGSLFVAAVCVVIVFSFCGCSTANKEEFDKNTMEAVITETPSLSPTPTPTAAPTPTPRPTATPAPIYWKLKNYVDEFGDQTDAFYVGSDYLYGTFSNSATNESDLTVSVAYDDNRGFLFALEEHGTYPATHYSSDTLTLKFKAEDTIYSCNLRAGSSSTSDLYTGMTELTPQDAEAIETMRDYLLRGTSLNCLIYIEDSKYQFRLPADGFLDAIMEYIDTLPEED